MFDDIIVTKEFIEDYDRLPNIVKKRVDRRIADWAITGKLPKSAQAHRSHQYDISIWIIYITCGHGAYRMLVRLENHKLHLLRVGDHEQVDRIIGLK